MAHEQACNSMPDINTADNTNNLDNYRSLQCLYDIEKEFSSSPACASNYQHVLDKIDTLLGFSGAAICLSNAGQQTAVMLASAPTEHQARLAFCQTRNCRACLKGRKPRKVTAPGGTKILHVPMATPKARYGVLSVRLPEKSELPADQIAIIEAFGKRLAQYAETAERHLHDERRLLREERLAMARDMHDSLAHTLAYMNIQMLRLRNQFTSKSRVGGNLKEIINELSAGLSDANAQVRELITTFRLNLPHGGFEAAVTHLTGQCAIRSKMRVSVNNGIPGTLLTANEQINIVQILKELLANAERHAFAKCVWIRIFLQNDGLLIMEVEDDGIGIPVNRPSTGRNQRYGLGIIRERAKLLRGKIRISRRHPNGTLVVLRFVPESCDSMRLQDRSVDAQ
ncbi:MAG: hypothetical protein KGK44_08845 [Gammaproteobacteria bacterium]|nr:hypothetical protein [Gammaproteobacteria bacterium]